MYTFQVKQKNRTKILAAFHFLVALIFILDLSHIHEDGRKDWIFSAVYFISCVFLLIVGIFYKKFLKGSSRQISLLLFESALFLGGAVYFWSKGASLVAFSHGIMAGVVILFWIYVKRSENGELIVVSENNVIVPGLSGKRTVLWNELTNLIKKDGLLTIDFKNNRLLQVQVDDENIPEEEFNQFCRIQLAVRNN